MVRPDEADPLSKGTADDSYWRKLGYDLDGRATTLDEITSGRTGCEIDRTTGIEDGDDGRDDAVGSGLLRYASSADSPNPVGNSEQLLNQRLEEGERTLVLELLDVGDGPDDPYVPGRLYLATSVREKGPAPKWDGEDVRPLAADSFSAGGVALNVFPNGYMRGDIWVSGEMDSLSFTLLFPFSPGEHPTLIRMPVRAGWITAKLARDRSRGDLTISVAMPLDAIRKQVECIALLARGCDEAAASQLRGFALAQVQPDLSLAATAKPDPATRCDGISFSAGGLLSPIRLGPVEKEVLTTCPQAACDL